MSSNGIFTVDGKLLLKFYGVDRLIAFDTYNSKDTIQLVEGAESEALILESASEDVILLKQGSSKNQDGESIQVVALVSDHLVRIISQDLSTIIAEYTLP